MTGAFPAYLPTGAALLGQWGRALMDVILHVGAHRTATTSFQHYMRDQRQSLTRRNIAFWGPDRTRRDIFPGLFRTMAVNRWHHVARRAEGRVKLLTRRAADRGVRSLIVSDENMIGTSALNFRKGALYPAIGERMARIAAAFDGQITNVCLAIRPQEWWWASGAALIVARGHPAPSASKCAAIARNRRGWRDVITDLACAVPGAQITVLPFDGIAGQPHKLLGALLHEETAAGGGHHWRNASAPLQDLRRIMGQQGADPSILPAGQGRWQPFSPAQCAALREQYADDLHWLVAGADGLAQLTENPSRSRAGPSLPPGQQTKGQDHAIGQGHLAQHR